MAKRPSVSQFATPGRPIHEMNRALMNSTSEAFDVKSLNSAYSEFTTGSPTDADRSAIVLIDLILSDTSGRLLDLMKDEGLAQGMVSVCVSRLSSAPSVPHMRLLLVLLTLLPSLQTDELAFFVFGLFSGLNRSHENADFIQFILGAVTLLIRETTVDHITASFTAKLKELLGFSPEVNRSVAKIFARCTRYIPLNVRYRHFAMFARYVVDKAWRSSPQQIAEGLVNMIRSSPRIIESAWVVEHIINIFECNDADSSCTLLDFLQSCDNGIGILGDRRVAHGVMFTATRLDGAVRCYSSAFRALRRYLEKDPEKCAEIYFDSPLTGQKLVWSVMSRVFLLPFGGKVEAGLLIAAVLQSKRVGFYFWPRFGSTTVVRDMARRMEDVLLEMLTLDHRDLLVSTLHAITSILGAVDDAGSLWREFGEVGIVAAIEAAADRDDDQVLRLIPGIKTFIPPHDP
jgi:hypothetical protein